MKTGLILAAYLVLASQTRLPAQDAPTGELHVTVGDVEGTDGHLVFAIWTAEEGFPREVGNAAQTRKVKPSGATAEVTFPDLPYGTYAVSVWHDADDSGDINANFLGMPRERVGASNQSGFGRPSFSRSRFELAEGRKDVAITFIN